jgi:molecular chaperone DnaK (HSP70)
MVYQGEDELYKNNHFLGKFTLTNIPPRPKGEPGRLECIMEVDKSGLLKVTAIDHCSG